MLALLTVACVIFHSTDKGLGPYVVYWPNYMNQGIKEHLNAPENYTRLSPIEAMAKLAEQKVEISSNLEIYSGSKQMCSILELHNDF